jgi:hypothetical protein
VPSACGPRKGEQSNHEWLRFMRRVGPGGTPFMFPFGPIPGPAAESSPQSLALEIDYYQSRPDEFMPPAHELVVDNIQMASPGGLQPSGIRRASS